MKKPIIFLMALTLLGGCGGLHDLGGPAALDWPRLHREPTHGEILSRTPADGRWIIADVEGERFCLTIQEECISIVNVGCRTDGGGFAARILDFPKAVLAGTHLVISTTYNPIVSDETIQQLTFSGDLHVDGSFAGMVIVETSIPPDGTQERRFPQETITERPAVLMRELSTW